jgi:hypothetical protein
VLSSYAWVDCIQLALPHLGDATAVLRRPSVDDCRDEARHHGVGTRRYILGTVGGILGTFGDIYGTFANI